MSEWGHKIFSVRDEQFLSLALEVFRFQHEQNTLYKRYCDALHVQPASVKTLSEIPFLPVQFFKTHKVVCGDFEPEAIFESSGTTQTINSRHYVKEIGLYRQSFLKTFQQYYGNIKDYCILALLPSYLERKNSSLAWMAAEMIKESDHPQSGFYLYDHDELYKTLQELESSKTKTILLGVSFGLLDFAEKYPLQLNHTIVMETGGMKGRREEWTRQQVHEYLQQRLGTGMIHSEYGMTELLSQAYSKGNGIFQTPSWMKVLLRDEDDPLHIISSGRGIINIIDLANIDSCSFIATGDAGKLYENGSFEILGRVDNSDIRGCSLMAV